MGSSDMTSFGLSSFINLHITVESQDHSKAAAYTITYSSGDPVLFLQDGLITSYTLNPRKTTKFVYSNPASSPIYLHLSAPDEKQLGKLETQMYAMDDLEDEDTMIQMTPETPKFGRKTPNPVHLMQLPAKKKYLFKITSKNDKDVPLSLGVNNR